MCNFKILNNKDDLCYELGGAVFAYEHYTFRKQGFLVEEFKQDVEKKEEIRQNVKEVRALEKDIDQVKKCKKVKTVKRETSRKIIVSSRKPNEINKPVTTF